MIELFNELSYDLGQSSESVEINPRLIIHNWQGGKNIKRRICSSMLVSMLLISVAAVLVSAEPTVNTEQTNVTLDHPRVGKVHYNMSAVLKELGYTEENMANVPSKLRVQIIRSYDVPLILGEDGDYYATITPDSPRAEVNLIGTDNISPYDLDISHAPDSSAVSDVQRSENSLDYEYEDQKACLVFEIWDYPGSILDFTTNDPQMEYAAITNDINSTGGYNYVKTLSNSECTWYYVWAWTTWACSMYEYVDVYWAGHGTEIDDLAAFVCYDAWSDWTGLDDSKCYMADDFTTGTYDYSTLRLGIGSLCYGGGLANTFINPGGTTTHDRVYISSDTEIDSDYTYHYINEWGNSWYGDNELSGHAHTQSIFAAFSYLGQGQSAFNYHGTTTSTSFYA